MNEHDTGLLERQVEELERQIRSIGPLMRGSVTFMGGRHKQPYFSVSIGGKTRVMYLGAQRTPSARQCVENYRKLMGLIDKVTVLRMQLLKQATTQTRTRDPARPHTASPDTSPKR